MDGGMGSTLSSLLHGLHSLLDGEARRYINQTDLFAGTSVGAMTSLFFANHDDPADALEDWDDFTRVALNQVLSVGAIPNFLGGLVGLTPVFNVERLRSFLVEYFGANLMLGELKKKVMVVTFELDNGLSGSARSWRPRIFSNLTDGPDSQELVVDLALRSSALPIAYPLYQSLKGTGPCYVDGFVVANNPSMIAVAEMIDEHPLEDMLVFSIGTGANILGKTMYLDPPAINGLVPWGYRQWMLDPTRPLLLLDLMSQSSAEAIDLQCQKFLKDRYFRLEPVLVNEVVQANSETQAILQAAVQWLQTSGWLETAAASRPERTPAATPNAGRGRAAAERSE
jgi:hypothetical protein